MATVSRLSIGAVLVTFGLLKIVSATPGPKVIAGIADLLSMRQVSVAAGAIELVVGAVLLSRFGGRAFGLVALWLASLSGITVGFMVGAIDSAGCGCLGTVYLPPVARVAVLAGLWLMLVVAVRSASGASRSRRDLRPTA